MANKRLTYPSMVRGKKVCANTVTSWSRILLEKLTVAQLVKNSPLIEPEGS